MTKLEFAKQLIETVTNNYDMQQDHENEPAVMALLEVLEPKDKEVFAKWGFPNQQSTVDDCW
ncbi:MAG: hypothetical protein H7Y10_12185 [Flavobacterium sp.]|nr:hypothetical protein [Flavobacterium sp.]